MRIGVISDTHGDLRSWQDALAGPFQGAGLIIHAGDILYHGPKNPMVAGYQPPALAEAINASPAPVIFARGNCDSAVDQLVIDYPIQAPYAFVQAEGIRVLLNHGDELTPPEMQQQAKRHRAQIFVFGHTHTPVLEKDNDVVLFNPGSPALPKSPNPTVGLIDTQTRAVLLVNLANGAVIQQVEF
ncbi:MAG: phosphodiesterase [Armatimonadetes bacterium]|nr:phosphodiesterase [Armatimonadota bacterium]NIM24121.1 phosphodiesterase [Armatimonadota bacterium]NIM67976.1 phosphodiesterase [Armatimonadota bacterium]NIM76491.1 phosphodiesterase [Armatimonadota bacterium]NIN06205.1 phosphodiesterase [Armatimonadota bacterium]